MAVVAILLTISLATMFVGLTMGAGYKANMKAYYPYDAGVAIDAPLEKSNMDSIVSFTEEHCGVEDSVSYYLYAVQMCIRDRSVGMTGKQVSRMLIAECLWYAGVTVFLSVGIGGILGWIFDRCV